MTGADTSLPPPPGADRPVALPRILLLLAFAAALALVTALALGLDRRQGHLAPGDLAPDFAFEDFQGRRHDRSSTQGKVVLLNFWASWCVECVPESAELEALWRELGPKGLVVLGLAYTDTEPEARAYVDSHGLSFPNGMDRAARVSTRYGLTGVPESVVIGRDGRLVPIPHVDGGAKAKVVGAIAPGGVVEPAVLREVLEGLLAAAPRDVSGAGAAP